MPEYPGRPKGRPFYTSTRLWIRGALEGDVGKNGKHWPAGNHPTGIYVKKFL